MACGTAPPPRAAQVVDRRRLAGGHARGQAVAFQTELMDLGTDQQLRVEASVRGMADLAFSGSDGGVVKDERTLFVRVAGSTSKLRGELLAPVVRSGIIVRTVTVNAAHRPLQDKMVEGLPEVRLRGGMAGDTKRNRLGPQQLEAALGRMHRMAFDAVDVVAAVGGLLESGEPPFSDRVAGLAGFGPAGPFPAADLLRVSAGLDMGGTRSVTIFAFLGAMEAAEERLGNLMAGETHLSTRPFRGFLACGQKARNHKQSGGWN